MLEAQEAHEKNQDSKNRAAASPHISPTEQSRNGSTPLLELPPPMKQATQCLMNPANQVIPQKCNNAENLGANAQIHVDQAISERRRFKSSIYKPGPNTP